MTDTKVNVSVQANVIRHKEKIKPGATFQKANCIDNLITPREGVYCRCNPAPWYARCPWPDIKPLHLPTRKPSPGFIFANKDWIKHNTSFTVDWENDIKKYMVKDGELTICKEFSYMDLARTFHELDSIDALEDYIVSDLAHEYDKIMIRKVLNMDSNRLNRFITMLDAVGGNFRIDQSVGERATAHINIPCDMLSHLHIDGDGSSDIFRTIATPKIPTIRNIQTFNDRVVSVTFADGTQTKCVCGKGETFDLYEGIAFCLFKRFLDKERGHKHFNDLMRYAFKKLDEQEKAKEREAEIEAENKRHEEKKKRQAERRKAKKREEQIGVFVEALRKNREIMMEEGWGPMVKPDEPNPYIAPGEPEPPVKPDEKTVDDGGTLFFDPLSGETFISSKDKILLAVMTLNKRILEHVWVSVNEWYEELGLDSAGNLGESMGWNADHLMQIDFAADFTSDGRNCYTIVYDQKPVSYREGRA